MTVERSIVPCNGCRACCERDEIILHPENGDVVANYLHHPIKHPLSGKSAYALDHKDNGECVYLGPTGCTIHDRAPTVCREFDCRAMVARFSRAERRNLVRRNMISKAVFEAGRARLDTLNKELTNAKEKRP